MANEIEKRNEAFLIYQDENGIARVNVRFEGEDVWLLQEQIMELFDALKKRWDENEATLVNAFKVLGYGKE